MPDKNRKLIDEFKALGAPVAMPSPRATKVSQFEKDYRNSLAREQAEREQAVKAGLTSWVTEIPGFVADLAVDAPYYLGQRAMGRRGDAIRPLGYGERVRAELATALGLQNPPSDEVGMRPPPANENITDMISLANPLAWSIAGDPIGLSKIGSKAFKSLGKAADKAAMAAGRAGERYGERVLPGIMESDGAMAAGLRGLSQGTQSQVIKPKGGNWTEGAPEKAVKGLKRGIRPQDVRDIEFLKLKLSHARKMGNVEEVEGLQKGIAQIEEKMRTPLNNWIEKQLARYIRNDLATPEDPIRALAEKGTLHFEPEGYRHVYGGELSKRREAAGYPLAGMAENPLGKAWEAQADRAITSQSAQEARAISKSLASRPPDWMEKLDPKSPIYDANLTYDKLGLNHLIDELGNAISPTGGLPPELMLKPESLSKLSVPQAVERVAKINAWREKQAAEAVKAQMEGIPIHKEYPEGYQWRAVPDTEADERALKYAMDIGCEGGWCTKGEDLARQYGGGGNRLYALHDPKGKVVAQIRTSPNQKEYLDTDEVAERFWDTHGREPSSRQELLEFDNQHPVIGEIKGRLNRPPAPELLPYVQDFVRSGKWSRVDDLENTGMRAAKSVFNEAELARLQEAGATDIPHILTGAEIQNLHNLIVPEGKRLKYDAIGNIIGDEAGYAKGGTVKRSGPVSQDAMQMQVWDKQVQHKVVGGLSKGAKGVGKVIDVVTDLKSAPKVGVASPLAMRSAADKAEEALQKTQAFKSLKGQDRQRAIDSVRAKAERSGIPRTKADLNAATAGEEDIARSMLNSPAYKIANVVPKATVNKALETRQMYRAEPPTTPGPNASEKEWADWGASHGVNMTVTTPESLGISDLTSRREAMIPGGLKGTFTIPDLFWMKANNFNPAALPQDVHTELMKKFIRTNKISSPDEVDVFNRLNFALLSPNAPLTPNEFLAQRARLRTPEELSALAGRVGEEGLNRTAATQLGVGQAGSGGMGVLGTADLSSQAMLAKLIKDKPSMFQMAPGETMRDVTMRVMNQAPGLGPKTASLGTPWLDLEKANTSAVDLHMIRDAYPMLLHDPIVGDAFRERMAGLLKTKPTAAAILSKPEKDVRDAAIAIVGGTDMSRLYRLKSGELNRIPDVATPDKLAYEPKSFSEFNPFYSRVVDYVDQSRGANPDIELFPEQWRKWDVLRQRIEPHEFAHPDYRKLPRQSFSEMQDALTAHKEAGYTQSNNPTMNLSDWRKLYYGRAMPEILAPTAAAGAAAAAAQTLLSDDSEKARGGAVNMAEGGQSRQPVDRSLPDLGSEERLRMEDYLRRMRFTGSGSGDKYGTGVGGRAMVNFPVGPVVVQPYVGGGVYKPQGGKLTGGVSEAGVNLVVPFAGGGAVRKALKAVLPKGQQDILSAAESTANLDRFLAESAVKDRMYHGTTYIKKPIKKFDPKGGGDFGSGIYFAENPNIANQYAQGFTGKESGAVYPAYLSIKNPFEVKNKYAMNSVWDEFIDQKNAGKVKESDTITDWLQSKGYDGVRVLNSGQDDSNGAFFVAFNPNQIKSAIGNRGTYDPAEADINKAKGGQVSKDAMWIALQNKQLRKKHGN